jgi:hypothetical protein
MIGVVAEELELPAVTEFFELFKSPWERYQPGRHYDVLLSSANRVPENDAALVLIYGSKENASDRLQRIRARAAQGPKLISVCGERIPIYGRCRVLENHTDELLFYQTQQQLSASSRKEGDQQTLVRIGCDLFHEVRYLLTIGQPLEFAGTPTLELHIAMLRRLIIRARLPFVEILPVPTGYPFIVCLTHDVDHPRVRYHVFDHTMFGFLYRAVFGSTIQLCRGRRSLRQVAVNWKAAISLPFVFAGLANDFWDQVNEYLALEKDLASTFFVIPVRGEAGVDPQGHSQAKRAASYDLIDVADDFHKLQSANREVGVHGIDAWCDIEKGRVERERVEKITGPRQLGTRMHWLYFGVQTPAVLEEAGFDYDSTLGYNETIGYRAGTTQVFKPLNARRLLELPLHIMDTALFYPAYMNLSDDQASAAMQPLIQNANRFGGVLTTNWHDRSLGPERLWRKPYQQLLDELQHNKPWFATASDVVSWFRKRRRASINEVTNKGSLLRAELSVSENGGNLPGLIARVHTPTRGDRPFVDVSVTSRTNIEVPI